MRRQTPSIRNPYYPLAYRIYLSLKQPTHPWIASELPFKLLNHQLTILINHGFIISRGKRTGKGGTPANVWVFNPAVSDNLSFIKSRQSCTHLTREATLFGEVYCRRLQHRMSLSGCRECLKYQIILPDQQSKLQQWGVPLPYI